MHLTNPFHDSSDGGKQMDNGMAQIAMARLLQYGTGTNRQAPPAKEGNRRQRRLRDRLSQ
jgi:hypothetical protein